MPRIIGLTGNIACGKSSVGHMLLELGAERYIDADSIVHRLYEPGRLIARRVDEAFGSSVMTAQGGVDRGALGALVFQDREAMKRLEQIVHPAVGEMLSSELAGVSPSGIAVIDAVKLLEGSSGAFCQSKWLVICPEEQELVRLVARNKLPVEDARARINAQPSITQKLALVDEVIDNGGPLEETYRQVTAAFARFCRKFPL